MSLTEKYITLVEGQSLNVASLFGINLRIISFNVNCFGLT